MGHFSMEIYAPTGSNLSGNQQLACSKHKRNCFSIVSVRSHANEGQNFPTLEAEHLLFTLTVLPQGLDARYVFR